MNIDNRTRLLSYVKFNFVMKDIYVKQSASLKLIQFRTCRMLMS